MMTRHELEGPMASAALERLRSRAICQAILAPKSPTRRSGGLVYVLSRSDRKEWARCSPQPYDP